MAQVVMATVSSIRKCALMVEELRLGGLCDLAVVMAQVVMAQVFMAQVVVATVSSVRKYALMVEELRLGGLCDLAVVRV